MAGVSDEEEIHDAENEEKDNNRDEPPLVFQCHKCNQIFGDSLAWVSASELMRSISLHSVTENVKIIEKLVTSTEGVDIGSTYLTLHCKGCDEHIGKVYKTTCSDFDDMRELFTLSVDKCNSYQCGSGELQILDDGVKKRDHIHLQEQITQLQSLMIQFNQRMLSIESSRKDDVNTSKKGDFKHSARNSKSDKNVRENGVKDYDESSLENESSHNDSFEESLSTNKTSKKKRKVYYDIDEYPPVQHQEE